MPYGFGCYDLDCWRLFMLLGVVLVWVAVCGLCVLSLDWWVLLRSRFLLLGFTDGFMGANSVGFVVLICILPDLFVLWC